MTLRSSLRNTVTQLVPAAVWKPFLQHYYLRNLKRYQRANDWGTREGDMDVIRDLVSPGETAVDAGANFGFYTAYLSGLVGPRGRVCSFEPVPLTFDMLKYNVRKLPMPNVQLFNCALSDRSGTAKMRVPMFESGTQNYYQARLASGEVTADDSKTREVAVETVTLDEALHGIDHISLIKVDVEGHEAPALRGAQAIIHDHRPALLVEMSGDLDDPRSTGSTLVAELRKEGYGVYWYDGTSVRPRQHHESSINFFFLTNAHLKRLANRADLARVSTMLSRHASPVSGTTLQPRVLITIATDAIGGPGKGLLQFLNDVHAEAIEYCLCNFQVRRRPDGEFVTEARRRGLKLLMLKQRAAIDPGLILAARRVMREQRLNLVQTHGYKSNILGFFLHLLFGVPWIGFAHGHTHDNWKMRLYNRIDLTVLRHADRVVSVSRATRDWLARHGVPKERLRLIYNAVDVEATRSTTRVAEIRLRHSLPVDSVVIGVVGRLNPEKGQIVFLQALERVIRTSPRVKALIIGDGQERASLERYCADHGLTEHVIFTGYRSDVAAYYQVMDILALPSLSEGLPNTCRGYGMGSTGPGHQSWRSSGNHRKR